MGSGTSEYFVLVVGAGFAGSVMAERIASQLDQRVLVVDRRPYVGGNAHDRIDEAGIRIHLHGPHLFHTNARVVVDYLSRFTDWWPYAHRVLSSVDGRLVPIPINGSTLKELYGVDLDEEGVARFLSERAEPRSDVRTSEDVVVARMGRELYEKLFRGYTRKHWGIDPAELSATVAGRIPVRTNRDDRYFTDWHQSLPAAGYTAMFERMLDHPNIDVQLSTSYEDVRDEVPFHHLVYTGPIDAFYDHRFGRLPYRSLHFEWERVATPDGGLVQPVMQINYPDESVPFTRTVEYRHLYGQHARRSAISREFPTSEGEPFYPIPTPRNRDRYRRYKAVADADPKVTFVGRLARYQYLNMDQVTAQALRTFERLRPVLRDAVGRRRRAGRVIAER
jgi:UDP-galactopyranose mutase